MRYVQRDENGLIVGHFANEQNYATELVADDHPDIAAFKARREARRGPTIRELVARIAELERKTALLP